MLSPLAAKASNYCPKETEFKEIRPGVIDIRAMKKQHNETITKYPLSTSKLEIQEDVKSISELDSTIVSNSNSNKKTLVVIGAQWSIPSKIMLNGVLTEETVQKELKSYMRININVTKNNDYHKSIYRKFKSISPPIFLIFNEEGILTKKLENKCLEPKEFVSWLSN